MAAASVAASHNGLPVAREMTAAISALLVSTRFAKARTSGLAAAGVFGGGHVGRLGEWVAMAAHQGLIALAFCNGGGKKGSVAPHGGVGRLLGTNPLASAVPVAGGPPIVVDFATSAVAEGKLRVARNRGQQVPEGLFLRTDGQPSTNPQDFYDGGVLLPAAGHKGYGLSLLVEALGGLLTGNGSPALPDFSGGNGVLFLLLDVAAFRPFDDFAAESAQVSAQARAVPPAPGFGQVMLPGEPEQRSAEQRAAGIPIDETTWAQLAAAVVEFGVDL